MRKSRVAPPEIRFWECVNKSNGCWEWNRGTVDGYGMFYVGDNKQMRAHRYSYILHFGAIPKGMFVCHKCDNPSCVRPDHLFAGTPKDNVTDMIAKNRRRTPSLEASVMLRVRIPSAILINVERYAEKNGITTSAAVRTWATSLNANAAADELDALIRELTAKRDRLRAAGNGDKP